MRSLLIGRDISISSVTDYELDFDDSVLEYVCELRPPAGLLLISQVIYMSMENHGGMMTTEKIS
jgi:hypothetical protein